jgi:hypothetical protein
VPTFDPRFRYTGELARARIRNDPANFYSNYNGWPFPFQFFDAPQPDPFRRGRRRSR